MSGRRVIILVMALIGLAANVWEARPADPTSIFGWLVSVAWPSAAWTLLCISIVKGLPFAGGIGALAALAAFDLYLLRDLPIDPLFLVVKPLYEVPIGFLGAAAAAYLTHLGREDA
jgi:hypothetical protein